MGHQFAVPGADRSLDVVRRRSYILVLPDTDDLPPGGGQCLIDPAITFDVGPQLLAPPLGVSLGVALVVGTAMPETAVNENGHPDAGEHDVRACPTDPGERQIYSVSKTSAVEFPTEG